MAFFSRLAIVSRVHTTALYTIHHSRQALHTSEVSRGSDLAMWIPVYSHEVFAVHILVDRHVRGHDGLRKRCDVKDGEQCRYVGESVNLQTVWRKVSE